MSEGIKKRGRKKKIEEKIASDTEIIPEKNYQGLEEVAQIR